MGANARRRKAERLAQRNPDRNSGTPLRTPMIDRPGHVCVVASDRATYGQFAGCLAGIQATPGSSQFWEFTGGGGIADARNLHVVRALKMFKKQPFWVVGQFG